MGVGCGSAKYCTHEYYIGVQVWNQEDFGRFFEGSFGRRNGCFLGDLIGLQPRSERAGYVLNVCQVGFNVNLALDLALQMAKVGEHMEPKSMRQLAFVILFLASLPVTANAAPFARYDPATGDVAFKDVFHGVSIALESTAGRMNFSSIQPIEIVPASAMLPTVGFYSWTSAGWRMQPGFFEFHTLRARGVVQPFTPLNDLSFLFQVDHSTAPNLAPIVQVPEPSALALAASSILGVSLIRRRGQRCLTYSTQRRRGRVADSPSSQILDTARHFFGRHCAV